jgi:hypothetical protein
MQGGLILGGLILTGGRLRGSAVNARHRQQRDRFRSRPFQNGTTGAGGSAGGHDIVDKENPQTFEWASTADAEFSPASHLRSDEIGLVEPPLKAAAPVQRHRDDGVESFIERQRPRQKFAQGLSQRLHPAVFEKMDQLPQPAFIEAEAVGSVEASRAGAAEGATAFEIEWKSILKGSLALRTEVIGGESAGRAQTAGADGNARIAVKRDLTDAAFVGKEDRKKSVRNLP